MTQQNTEPTLEDWQKKICDSYEAGTAPSYDDLEGALLAFIKDNERLQKLMHSMVHEISKVVVPRVMQKDEGSVLAALDDFIARRTSIVHPQKELH